MMRYAILALMFMSVNVHAGYFKLADPENLVKVQGVYIDPVNPKYTSVGSAIALITHSVADGCMIPSIVCSDWSPAMAGFSYSAGRFQFNIGPAINLTPVVKMGLLGALNGITNDDTLLGVKSALGSQPIAGPDVSMSFGPSLNFSPVEHGVIIPVSEWKGRLRIFAGAALRFR